MDKRKSVTADTWIDPDDAPELTEEWFAAAEISIGDKVIRPARPLGRPKSANPKEAVNLRLDADLVAHFRATGAGWQTRVNEALRKVAGL